MTAIISFLNTYAAAVTILITLVAGVYKFGQFVNIKKTEALQRDYENFHDLVGKLVVDRQQEDGRPFIDIQIASAYELKNYPRYFKVSSIILERMKVRLDGKPEQADLTRVIDKVHSYINKNWLFRKFVGM